MLSGDRLFAEDKSVIAGFGTIENKSVLIIGAQSAGGGGCVGVSQSAGQGCNSTQLSIKIC